MPGAFLPYLGAPGLRGEHGPVCGCAVIAVLRLGSDLHLLDDEPEKVVLLVHCRAQVLQPAQTGQRGMMMEDYRGKIQERNTKN